MNEGIEESLCAIMHEWSGYASRAGDGFSLF